MRKAGLLLAAVLWLATGAAWAQSATALAKASAVQPPVWIERGGIKTALRAGESLYAGDRFSTGAGGRLHIEFSDSSVVKLGENAGFELPELTIVNDNRGSILKGALRVLRGAFRYTTTLLGEGRRRDFTVSVGATITAGIRGTDIWGKSETRQELLCLLQGRIEVSSPGQPAVVMDQPMTFYVVPRNQPPKPVAPVPADKAAIWFPQTELPPDVPSLLAGGQWAVMLATARNQPEALKTAQQYVEQGYPVEVRVAQLEGATVYRLVIGGLGSRGEAARYAVMLRTRLGLKGIRVLEPSM